MARLAPPLLWVTLWWALSIAVDLQAMLLPDLRSAAVELPYLVGDSEFPRHLLVTLLRVLPGIVLAAVAGTMVGMSLAAWKPLRLLLEPVFSFFRGIPVATLFPAAIILFGIGEGARLALNLYVSFPIVVVATMTGALERPENRTRREYLRLQKNGIAWWHHPLCLLWDALPSLLSGLKIALALSLVVIIVSEMFFVGGLGAGWFIWDQYQSFNVQRMYACILLVGVVSYSLSAIIDALQSWVDRR